jgi:hypothetical protein
VCLHMCFTTSVGGCHIPQQMWQLNRPRRTGYNGFILHTPCEVAAVKVILSGMHEAGLESQCTWNRTDKHRSECADAYVFSVYSVGVSWAWHFPAVGLPGRLLGTRLIDCGGWICVRQLMFSL